jgi:serine O-acetyltransferase
VGIPGVTKPARSSQEELRDAQFYIDPAIYI